MALTCGCDDQITVPVASAVSVCTTTKSASAEVRRLRVTAAPGTDRWPVSVSCAPNWTAGALALSVSPGSDVPVAALEAGVSVPVDAAAAVGSANVANVATHARSVATASTALAQCRMTPPFSASTTRRLKRRGPQTMDRSARPSPQTLSAAVSVTWQRRDRQGVSPANRGHFWSRPSMQLAPDDCMPDFMKSEYHALSALAWAVPRLRRTKALQSPCHAASETAPRPVRRVGRGGPKRRRAGRAHPL